MGYSTDFEGSMKINPPLSPEQVEYINTFSRTRRMKRDLAEQLPDPIREAVGLPIGDEGAYFVGGTGFMGQDRDSSVVDGNRPPSGQPGLWCQWEVSKDGTELYWDGGEKFYDYVDWLQYLYNNFFSVWGNNLDGEITWQGQEPDDKGKILCMTLNSGKTHISTKIGRVVYE